MVRVRKKGLGVTQIVENDLQTQYGFVELTFVQSEKKFEGVPSRQ